MTGIGTVKSMAMEPRAIRVWGNQLAAYVTAGFRITRLAVIGQQGVHLVQKLVSIAILYFGAKLVKPHALPPIQGRVRFEGVSFRYRVDSGLMHTDLDVAVGEVVGVVGRSDSGKSTLSKLVQRLYCPERCRVLIDGHDLALADPAWLRRRIGVVLQENSGLTAVSNVC